MQKAIVVSILVFLACVAILAVAFAETGSTNASRPATPADFLGHFASAKMSHAGVPRFGGAAFSTSGLTGAAEECSELETTETMKSAAICKDLILQGLGDDPEMPAKIKLRGEMAGILAEGSLGVCSGNPKDAAVPYGNLYFVSGGFFDETSPQGAALLMGNLGEDFPEDSIGMEAYGMEVLFAPNGALVLGEHSTPRFPFLGAALWSSHDVVGLTPTGTLILGESGTTEFTNSGAMLSANYASTPDVKRAIIRATNKGVYGTEGTPLASMEVADANGIVQGSVRVNGETNPPAVRMANALGSAVTVQGDGDVVITLGPNPNQ